jgi:hypothetical protein
MVIGGEPITVSWFREIETPRPRFASRWAVQGGPTGPRDSLVLGAAFTCAVAPILVLVDAPSAVRMPFVLALLSVVPGIAALTALRGLAEPGLVAGMSLGLSAVIAQSMLWLGVWEPRPALYATAVACLLPLSWRLATTGTRITRGAAWRRGAARLIRRVRVRRLAVTPATAGHMALVVLALVAWATSLMGADLSEINGVGLLAALPPTYILAFALLLTGFAVAVSREDPSRRLLGAYVLVAIVVIHGTTALLYDQPRYAWTYKHLGVINLIAATGRADRQIDIYNNWPSFFALNAWFSKTSGLAPIAYAGWAQLFFNLFNVVAVRFALRGLTRNERILWTAALFFVVGNWVGQDYLAPQAFAFPLSLVVLGLCLRSGREVLKPPTGLRRWCESVLSRVARAVLPDRTRKDEPAQPPIGRRAALVAGGVCFVAVVTSHQLSPVMLILSLLSLALATRRVSLWVLSAMVVIELGWVAMAWGFVHAHFTVIELGGGGAAAPGRKLSAAVPGAKLSLLAPAAVMASMAVLALVGLVRRLAQGKLDLVPAALIGGPLAVVAVQSYGGEGIYRAYLFALPWLSFLAASACLCRRLPEGEMQISLPRLLVAAPAVGACLLVAFFGEELANRVSTDDVRASAWYEHMAPAGSMRIGLAPNAPERLTARYPQVSLSDPPTLVSSPGFTAHRLGASDIPRLISLIDQHRARPAYVVLSRLEENYARLNGLLPAGSLTSFVAALGQSPAFRLVHRLPTVWIFQYAAHPNSSPSPAGRS